MDFWEVVSEKTNIYHCQNSSKHETLHCTPEEILKFVAVEILMGCLRLPQARLYWCREINIGIVSEIMPRNRYYEIRNNIHFVNNLADQTSNKLWKVQPLITAVRNKCLTLPRSSHLAIDEQMIPFAGKCDVRTFMPSKPNPLGLKNFVMASPDGLILDFHVYTGKGFLPDDVMKTMGLGAGIVTKLCETVDQKNTCVVYTDRYFTSLKCAEVLLEKKHLSNRKFYKEYMKKSDRSLKTNPRFFWKFVNMTRKTDGFPKNMFLGNETSSSGQESANLFAKSFSSAYITSDASVPDYPLLDRLDFNGVSFSSVEVFRALSSLPLKFSSGPDNVPPYILRKCASCLADPLSILFNKSLLSGKFPSSWKSSFVFPIHKSGDRSNISNYRGVCIQSAIPKVLDKLVSSKLSFACRHFICDQQHGFTAKRSTSTNLLCYQQDILSSFQAGNDVHAVYTDVAKAFDRVNTAFLIAKLRSYGIGESFLTWLESAFHGRTQRVKIGDCVSASICVTSGVGQGSHSGPLFFSLFFNDLPNFIRHSRFQMYADDVKMYRSVSDFEDCTLLQQDLDSFYRWLNFNGLQLTLHKCAFIYFSRRREAVTYQYHLDSQPLNQVDVIKDLGNLTTAAQLRAAESKAGKYEALSADEILSLIEDGNISDFEDGDDEGMDEEIFCANFNETSGVEHQESEEMTNGVGGEPEEVDKLISIQLKPNEILEKLDMLQKTVNHLMTRREAASSSTELQDLLKKLPLKTPLNVEIFQDNLTDSAQRALEKTSLKECVLKYAHLVENKTDAVSNKQKNEGWEKIAAEMRAQPGVLPVSNTPRTAQKHS
ncbi:hypothetical protein M8J77_014540 [Diaphorina citri]|nr:hypothetical protein M8J77_014540 [Diaphorina citri]